MDRVTTKLRSARHAANTHEWHRDNGHLLEDITLQPVVTTFTPVSAIVGGALIGLAAAVLLLANGRIMGVSGILGGLYVERGEGRAWRVLPDGWSPRAPPCSGLPCAVVGIW